MAFREEFLESVHFSNIYGTTRNVDEDGNYDGNTIIYKQPETVMAMVSADSGEIMVGVAGMEMPYAKTLIVPDKGCGIMEGAAVWFGTPDVTAIPDSTNVTVNSYDYVVKYVGVAKCISYMAVGLDKVE